MTATAVRDLIVIGPVTAKRVGRPAAVASLLFATVFLAGCHEKGDVEVRSLQLNGVHAFKASDIKPILATQESGKLPWSTRRFFDRAQFEGDLKRITAFYADHGYEHTRITKVDAALNDKRDAVTLRVDIDEGPPVIVDDVRFEGFDVLPPASRGQLQSLPLKVGQRRDHDAVKSSRDEVVKLLHDNGYPLAHIDADERPSPTEGHVIITFHADPGPRMVFGDVSYAGLEHVDQGLVQEELAFGEDQLYQERLVLRTQRRLSGLELFQVVTVSPQLDATEGNRVPIRITVAEAPERQLNFGVGYGSEDRARVTVDWRHLNFLGGGRQAELEGKASYLDRGVKLTLTEPRLSRPGLTINFSGEAWRTSQLLYDSENYGGRVTAIYHIETGLEGLRGRRVRYNFKFGYQNEYLRYGVKQNALTDFTSRDELITLGLDPFSGRGSGTLAALDFDFDRTAVDNQLEPTRGLITSLHLEHAAPWLLGSYRFDEFLGEARGYEPVHGVILAGRAKAGLVSAAQSATVPFSKLYFLGGATSLRGWGLYEVSPLDPSGLPVGGRSLVELSGEVRVPFGAKLLAVGFVDAGDVGRSSLTPGAVRLRVDAGPGVRYRTPIGVIRADLGLQLTPIKGLLVDGQSESRHWRVHFSIGEAF